MPPRSSHALAGLVAAGLLVLASCSGSDDAGDGTTSDEPTEAPGDIPGTVPDDASRISEREWVLDPAESSVETAGDQPITLRLQLGEVVGSGGCSTYQGPVETDGSTFSAGPFRRTVADCAPDVVEAEDRYLAALERAEEVEVDGEVLTLSGPDDVELTFRTDAPVDRLTSADLVGRWRIERVADAPVIEGTDPVLIFGGDGRLSGALGCNTVSGFWTLDGTDLRVSELSTTGTACSEPAGVADQERSVLDALAAVEGHEWAGGEGLVLTGGEAGDTLVVLRRVS